METLENKIRILEAESNSKVDAQEYVDLYRELEAVKAALKVALEKLSEYEDTDSEKISDDNEEDQEDEKIQELYNRLTYNQLIR